VEAKMTEQQQIALQGYRALLDDLISRRSSPVQFESKYLQRFKSETITFPESVFMVLDRLFADVDAYCADSSIRDPDDLGDTELIASAKRALFELGNHNRYSA
jgi:Bacterial self-protective colicin-like immunity